MYSSVDDVKDAYQTVASKWDSGSGVSLPADFVKVGRRLLISAKSFSLFMCVTFLLIPSLLLCRYNTPMSC
jgi:hypothetical protein